MRDLDVGPLTWTYVKLLGQQLRDNVRDWDELPNSHAWTASPTSLARRLLTKAHCVGVLVSIHQRAERAELLIDDGTALIRAVLWTPSWDEQLALGDLVRVQGKLNMDSSWGSDTKITGVQSTRELRVVRIHKIVDPNEELLHWLDVVELTATVCGGEKTGAPPATTANEREHQPSHGLTNRSSSPWDSIVTRAFRELEVDDAEVAAFLCRTDSSPHDRVLICTLRDLVLRQRMAVTRGNKSMVVEASKVKSAVRFSFPNLLHDALGKESVAAADALHHATTRSLRHAFTTLRSSGLVFLEDTDADQYVFLSADFALAPSLLTFLQKKISGASIAEIADWVFTQERFKRVSIDSLEHTLQRLLQAGQLEQRDDSQQFFYSRIFVSSNP